MHTPSLDLEMTLTSGFKIASLTFSRKETSSQIITAECTFSFVAKEWLVIIRTGHASYHPAATTGAARGKAKCNANRDSIVSFGLVQRDATLSLIKQIAEVDLHVDAATESIPLVIPCPTLHHGRARLCVKKQI